MASEQVMNAADPDAEPPARPPGGLLRNGDFVRLWTGQSVSLMGTQVTLFTLPLVAILTLHASVLQVGILNAMRLAPVVVVALIAGVWLDAHRRRPVLVTCALCCTVLIALVPIGGTAGFLSMGLLYAVAAVVGGLNVVFDVGSLSYVPGLVEPRHLPEANGKLQASNAVAGVSGPAIAGALVGLITAPVTLSVDAVSYLFSAAGLLSIRRHEPAPEPPEQQISVGRQIAEGFRAVYGSKLLRALLTQTAALNLSYGAFYTVFLVYAVRVLGLTPLKLGFVVGSGSVGALLGALLASRGRLALGMGRNMGVATIGASGALLLVLIPHNASVSGLLVMMAGQVIYGAGVVNLSVNGITLRQIVTPRRVLARMNATYRMLLFGAPPLGSVIGGVLGTALGLRLALLISLLALTSPMLWLLFSPVFRLREMPSGPDDAIVADG
ncbi:MAG TPA: MFS transporter [Streptosporangiaceae bacterium]|jgi:MFS family permease